MMWTTTHQALLNAYEAGAVVPLLFSAATNGRLTPTDVDVRTLRDWPQSLYESPCADLLDDPTFLGSTGAWQKLFDVGLSDRAAHHTALLFLDLSSRLSEARHFDEALPLMELAGRSWKQIRNSGYLAELFATLGGHEANLPLESTLDHLLDTYFDDLLAAAQATFKSDGPGSDFTKLEFLRNAIEAWYRGNGADETPQLTQFERLVSTAVMATLDADLGALDLGSCEPSLIETAYRNAVQTGLSANMPDELAERLSTSLIETLWTLRRVGRDELPVFNGLIDLAMEVAAHLERGLFAGRIVGHNARCADIFSFRAERERGDDRVVYLDRALEVCPGHRNASMLRSYVFLGKANVSLAAAETVLIAMSARPHLREARRQMDRAIEVFASNKDLPTYEERFLKACFKHKIDPSELRTDGTQSL